MVFLSYAREDHLFAELAAIKLGEADIVVWRDQGRLRAGADWRQGIEQGVADSLAVLVALSAASSTSPYVTYEWAYALGKGKPLIPVKLGDYVVHPKLEAVQYLDFSVPGALPWESLIERIQEIEIDRDATLKDAPGPSPVPADSTAAAILAYLNQRGYQMVSFDRLRKRIDPSLTDERLNEIIKRNPQLFRKAVVRGDRPGLAKLIP